MTYFWIWECRPKDCSTFRDDSSRILHADNP